jgi:broad specificity phosphatase PhoE
MATLYLIRHGQASFGKADYDQLSDTGWEQSRVLGRWLSGKLQPASLFSGDMRRHRETVSGLAEGYQHELPKPQQIPGFNEFDHTSVIHALKPAWADHSVMQKELAVHAKPARAFQATFGDAIRRWVSGEHDHDYAESWPFFQQRVIAALETVIAESAGGDSLVVSSGGPISVIVQALLGLNDQRALGLNEVIANTSATRVLFSGERRSLAVFNSYDHLEVQSPSLVTFR